MKIRYAVLALLLALPSLARELPREPAVGNLAQRIHSARSLMRTRPDLALQLLEQLDREYPGQDHLKYELAHAYLLLEHFDEAEVLLRELQARSPDSTGIGAELARLLLRSGREEEGRGLAEKTYLSGRLAASAFRGLADLYRSADRYDLAEEAFRLGLERLPERDEPGRVVLMEGLIEEYSLSGRVDAILRAFAVWPWDYDQHAPTRSLLRRAERLLREQGNLDTYADLADSLSASAAGEKLAPLLREIDFAGHRWDAYLREVLRAYPSDPARRSAWLSSEALRCEAWPEVARPIWDRVLADDPESRQGRQARLALVKLDLEADALDRLRGGPGLVNLADELEGLAGENWGAAVNLEIHLARQDFLRRRLVDLPAAEAAAREALLRPYDWFPREKIWRLEAELGLDLLALGRDDEARGLFEGLLEAYRPREDAPAKFMKNLPPRRQNRVGAFLAARFQLAGIDILAGNPAAAQDSLAALGQEYPGSREANDALAVALLLAEAATWPESLNTLMIGSLELEIRQHYGEAADRLAVFAEEFPEDESLPTMLFRMGGLYEQAFRSADALAAWKKLDANFPDHPRAASALERAARLALRMGDREQARNLVERLLDEHPESTQIPDLRELREQASEDA